MLKQWEAVYVGYVLDPHPNLKMVTLHGKGNASFFVQLNDHVQVPFFFLGGQYVSVDFFSAKYICLVFISCLPPDPCEMISLHFE